MWLDKNALTKKGWTLDETPALQVTWLSSCTLICLDAGMTVGTFPPWQSWFFFMPQATVNKVEKHWFSYILQNNCNEAKQYQLIDISCFSLKSEQKSLAQKLRELKRLCILQIHKYEVAYRNGFRCKSACQFAVKPIADSSSRVEDFSCMLYFRQIDHPEDSIYVNPGFPLLPLPVRKTETAARRFLP